MASKLSKQMEAWHQAEIRHAAIFGKAALRTRSYQRIRLTEMQRIYRENRRAATLDDRVRLRMLRAGNRHLERKLYPNRLIRYTRRLVLFTFRVIRRSYQRIRTAITEKQRPLREQPAIISQQAVKPVIRQTPAKTRIVRLPKPLHQPLEIRKQKQGRSL